MQLPGAHFSPKFKQEIKLSSSNNKKCLIFSQKKAFVIFQEMEIWKKKFFIFQERTLKSQAKKFSYFLRVFKNKYILDHNIHQNYYNKFVCLQ